MMNILGDTANKKDDIPEYLYHYTSIETLAMILKTKKLKFSSLENVDDVEEVETPDLKNFGRYIYVSCWTDNDEDTLPMWNMYTPDMKGVRIKMHAYPFKEYYIKKGECDFTVDWKSYIDYKQLFKENKGIITPPKEVDLIKIDYENRQKSILVRDEHTTLINLEYIGKFKRYYWSFQQEWRYKIKILPGNKKMKPKELFEYLINENTPKPYNEYYLDINEDAFNTMEILLGPKTSEAEKVIVESLVKSLLGYDIKIKKSRIRINT